ncbi:MAG: hypothetical protein M1818_001575 [Claussenomyces sp. TS43310]|nr:MAG: hypothetical protein M1818_001575 [Claussenomyces sp. TS43310]
MAPNARRQLGTSDPLSYTCRCAAQESSPAEGSRGGGRVLLFYRYFSAEPVLLPQALPGGPNAVAQAQADFHSALTARLHLAGKIRVAAEGFNVTVGGTVAAIEAYMAACAAHWSFAGLPLASAAERDAFFKPTPGCACVFGSGGGGSGGGPHVRVCAEITPMGVTGYEPRAWSGMVEDLEPAEFHRRCVEEDVVLVDVRNHYESRIGYFVAPRTCEIALRPAIRRFSQWPAYVRRHLGEVGRRSSREGEGGGDGRRPIMTYCTGGIRCEKATRWMAENLASDSAAAAAAADANSDVDVGRTGICALKGGVAAYLTWMDAEIGAGRKRAEESLYKGRNYVFDARGSLGLQNGATMPPVSRCHVCAAPSDRLSKCRSRGCHLVLVACEGCEAGDLRCCGSCRVLDEGVGVGDDGQGTMGISRAMCACEEARERELWGGGLVRRLKGQGQGPRSGRRTAREKTQDLDIRVKIVEEASAS